MKNNFVPIAFFPTQVLVIDDNLDFLHSIDKVLPKKFNNYSFYQNPTEAINELNNNGINLINDTIDHLVKYEDNISYQHNMVDINIRDIRKIYSQLDKHKNISSIIIDYDMGFENGLSILEKITNPYINKIMLTGVGDSEIAMEAFHKGLIHGFVSKHDNNCFKEIEKLIEQGNINFFNKIFNIMTYSIFKNPNIKSAIFDKDFAEIFFDIIKTNNIVEYYIFEDIGSFFMVDENREVHLLFVANDATTKEILEHAYEHNVDYRIIEDIKNRKKMLCYFDANSVLIPDTSKWKFYLNSCNTNKINKCNYYYSLVKNFSNSSSILF
jgi:CheY-like chemotaxis protein